MPVARFPTGRQELTKPPHGRGHHRDAGNLGCQTRAVFVSAATAVPVVVGAAPAVAVPTMTAPRRPGALIPAVAVTTIPAALAVVTVVAPIPAVLAVAARVTVVGLDIDGRALGMPRRRCCGRRGTPGTDNGSACHGNGGDGDTHALLEAAHGFLLRIRERSADATALLSLVHFVGRCANATAFAGFGWPCIRVTERESLLLQQASRFRTPYGTTPRVNHTTYGNASGKFRRASQVHAAFGGGCDAGVGESQQGKP